MPVDRPPRTVLIVCLRLLGDVVLSLPLVDMVLAEHPRCAIDFLVPKGMGALLRSDPRIRRVLEHGRGCGPYLPRILRRYDWAIGTNGSDRTVLAVTAAGRRVRVATVDANPPRRKAWKRLFLTGPTRVPPGKPVVKWTVHLARAAGLHPVRCAVHVHRSAQDEAAADEFLGGHQAGTSPFMVLHALSRHRYKEWDPQRVAQVSDQLCSRHGWRAVWTGGGSPAERRRLHAAAELAKVKPILAAGALDLGSLTALIARARLYIGVDTAVTHLAASTGIPVIALFGPTPTRYWSPWNNDREMDYDFPFEPGSFRNGHISVLQDAEAFAREHHWGAMDTDAPSASMAAITVDQVTAEADHLLSRPSVHSPA